MSSRLRFLLLSAFVTACASEAPTPGVTAFVGATIVDGTGGPAISDGVLVVRDGRIEAVGSAGEVSTPRDAAVVDVSGKTIIPGLINTHGHVGDVLGLQTGQYSAENVRRQLALNARYGVTTVNSLGGDREEGIAVRDAQETSSLDRSRLLVAGTVVAGDTPDAAIEIVDANAEMEVDFIKIRVDDNLGTSQKMPRGAYAAVIARAHELDLPVAAHLFYLDDAKALLEDGADFLVHSVRDQPVDDELIEMLASRGVCYSPTLAREVSTFVYESVPDFFEDPFFLREVDPAILDELKDPARQAGVRNSASAQRYKEALRVAQQNLVLLSDGGVTIAFGTDTGPSGRFQGYFEHMEMELMAEAGMSPMAILVSATGNAARCLGRDDIGTLEAGKWADLVVLGEDPLIDIGNTNSIESVWVAGNRVPEATD